MLSLEKQAINKGAEVMKNGVYYDVKDVMEILAYGKTKAYAVIKKLNNELESKGYMIRPGLITKSYFDKRFKLS